jgi:hypothetical protein
MKKSLVSMLAHFRLEHFFLREPAITFHALVFAKAFKNMIEFGRTQRFKLCPFS